MPVFRCLITLLLFLFCQLSFSQQIRFNQFTTKDGLLSDEVYNLHQDKKGYLWCFTNYGALKYNGNTFKPVLKNLPFGDSFIYSIYENKEGRKWIANSNEKIYEIINDSAFQVPGTEETSELLRKKILEVIQLYVDDSLNIYAQTKHDSYKFIKTGPKYRPVKLGFAEDSIAFHVFDKEDALYKYHSFTGNDSTFCGGRKELKILLHQKNGDRFFAVDCIRSAPRFFKHIRDKIYFSQHNRLVRIDHGEVTGFINFNTLITNFTCDKNGHIWVACYTDGLYELDKNDSVVNHYLEKLSVNDVLADSQNGLWVSTVSGLFHCSNLNNYYFPESQPLGQHITLLKKIKDELFVGNTSGDIFVFRNGQRNHFKDEKKAQDPWDLIKEGNDYLIISRYLIQQKGFLDNLSVPVNLEYGIKLSCKGKDTLYILQRKRFYILENRKFREIKLDYRAYSFEVRGNQQFLGMDNGIWKISDQNLIQPAYLSKSKDYRIKSITKDMENNLWFCSTGGGLFKLDLQNRLQQFTNSNGLPENVINSINFEKNGILLSTNSGLYFSVNFNGKGNWKKLFSGSVEQAVLFEDKIYLSTLSGLVILDERKIHEPGQFYFNLNTIRVNSEEIPVSMLNSLQHGQNNLEFIFDLVSFNNNKCILKYKLNGETKDSNIVDGNALGFQKLPPGNYTLEVEPLLTSSMHLDLQVQFTIIPAFWQTGIFVVIMICSGIFLSILITSFVFRMKRKRTERKNKAERLIQEYKLIALKAQINPHFMSNCLTAIQHLIINNQVDLATVYIAKFGLLVRQILNFSARSLVTLKEELEITVLNIELEQLRFKKKFTFEMKAEDTIDPKRIYVPALILNPIIENAIWHGLLPVRNEKQGILLIDIKIENNMLLLIVEDNGKGRGERDTRMGNTRESKGIDLTKQRLHNINYMFGNQESQLVYVDLKDKNGFSNGTRVIISLPTNLEPLKNE